MDAFICQCLITSAIIAVYAPFNGFFPLNAFVSALLCSIGLAAFTAGLKMKYLESGGKCLVHNKLACRFIIFKC